MKILPTLCYCITAIIVSYVYSISGRFEMRDMSGVPYVINRATGDMWKFYLVPAEDGKPVSMGFQRMHLQ